MKKLCITLLCVAVSITGMHAQTGTNAAKFKFNEGDSYNFKTLKEGPPAQHVFEFTNTGTEPLIIQNVMPSCSCTTPEWSKDPVLPGKKGKITVVYTTQGHVGPFTKDVYIQSNVVSPDGKYTLHIAGTVEAPEPTAKN